MKTTFIMFSVIVVAVLVGAFSTILPSQQTSAQMMNPNMMFNGSLMNPMFMQDQNITGSIKLAPTLINSIASQIKVSLSDAAAIVQNQAGNKSNVVAAHLDVANSYLVYTVVAVDPDANIHKLIIDAGNGKVLSSSKSSLQNMMMFGGLMNPNMMGSMMNPHMMGK